MWIDGESLGGEVEQPARDHRAAPPHLRDIGQVQVVAVELRLGERRCLRVDGVVLGPDVGRGENVEPLGVRRHDAVFDPVVHHLHEVAGPARTAVQPAKLRRSRSSPVGFSLWRSLGRLDARGKGVEDRRQPLDSVVRTADHQAVPALEAVRPPARADVDVLDAVIGVERAGPPDVVAVPGVATVDQRVAAVDQRHHGGDRRVDERGGHHDPDVAGRAELADELLQGLRTGHSLVSEGGDRRGIDVVAHALVTGRLEAAHHVGSHAAEADHPELHGAHIGTRLRTVSP